MIKIENVKTGDTFVFYRHNPDATSPGFFYTVGNRYTVQDVVADHIYMTDNHCGGHRWSEEMFNFCFSKPQRKVRKVKRIAGVYQLVRIAGYESIQIVDCYNTTPAIGNHTYVYKLFEEMCELYPDNCYQINRLVITQDGTTSEPVATHIPTLSLD
jgi:hypothetical protein